MKKVTINIFKMAFLALFTTVAISCSNDDDNNGIPSTKNTSAGAAYEANVDNISSNVIVTTYADLASKGEALLVAAKTLQSSTTDANLTAVKTAWQNARAPWEKSEGFLYGPVDVYGVDPAIDSWPVNVTDMNALLEDTSVDITVDAIDEKLGNTAKGFHLIEWLLWGTDGNKTATSFTTRELTYLVAASQNLRDKTALLHDSWKADGDNYVANFLNAGTGSVKYTSTKAAIEDIITGMVTIADEVGNAKIEDPFNGNSGAGDVTKEESRFSHNSKLDFANNIRSIQNIFNGKYDTNGDGKGIKQVLTAVDASLATKVETEITAAITAIEGISGTFTSAITNDRAGVEKAQKAVQALLASLQSAKAKVTSSLK